MSSTDESRTVVPLLTSAPWRPSHASAGVLRIMWGVGRGALEGKGPQRRPKERLDGRLEEVAEAVGGGYCRLQMPLSLAPGVRETVAGHRLGALERGGGGLLPFQCISGVGQV